MGGEAFNINSSNSLFIIEWDFIVENSWLNNFNNFILWLDYASSINKQYSSRG